MWRVTLKRSVCVCVCVCVSVNIKFPAVHVRYINPNFSIIKEILMLNSILYSTWFQLRSGFDLRISTTIFFSFVSLPTACWSYIKTSSYFPRNFSFVLFIWYCTLVDLNATFGAWLCMVLKLGRFGQQIRKIWKVLKCGAGEGWIRLVGPIMWEMKKCYLESMSRGISYMKYENGRLTELVTSYVEIAF